MHTASHQADRAQPLVGVGSCLVGEPVRFNGDHKRSNPHINKLGRHVILQTFCPEVAIGLGVPRDPIRIVEIDGRRHLRDSDTQQQDYTTAIESYAENVLHQHPELCGYILVKGSPSCGYERVKRYHEKGNIIASDSMGIYAQRLRQQNPLLPMEEDGRLYDHGLRESFVSRVYLYHDWQQFSREPYTAAGLLQFYSRYKYLIMAHSVPMYQQLGRLMADLKRQDLNRVAQDLIGGMMDALQRVASAAGHTNVLQHLQGYLKKTLSTDEKQELSEVIDQFRRGIVPLITPLTLLQHHFRRSPDNYIGQQTFMAPYPGELALRSFVTPT